MLLLELFYASVCSVQGGGDKGPIVIPIVGDRGPRGSSGHSGSQGEPGYSGHPGPKGNRGHRVRLTIHH